jgi:hypothetical protein
VNQESVRDPRLLVGFLYRLVNWHFPAGIIEELIGELEYRYVQEWAQGNPESVELAALGLARTDQRWADRLSVGVHDPIDPHTYGW